MFLSFFLWWLWKKQSRSVGRSYTSMHTILYYVYHAGRYFVAILVKSSKEYPILYSIHLVGFFWGSNRVDSTRWTRINQYQSFDSTFSWKESIAELLLSSVDFDRNRWMKAMVCARRKSNPCFTRGIEHMPIMKQFFGRLILPPLSCRIT